MKYRSSNLFRNLTVILAILACDRADGFSKMIRAYRKLDLTCQLEQWTQSMFRLDASLEKIYRVYPDSRAERSRQSNRKVTNPYIQTLV